MFPRQVWTPYAAVAFLLMGLCLFPPTSLAHPLGNFSISHYTEIRLEPHGISLRYILDLAEIPTFQEIQDTGIDPQVQHPRVRAYLTQKAEAIQEGLFLVVNGQRLALKVVSSEILFPPGAGGLPTLKLGMQYHASLATVQGDTLYRVHYRDTNFPGRAGWQEILAMADAGITLLRSSVPTTDRSKGLTDYPTDLLNSPPQILEAHVLFKRASLPQAIATLGSPSASQPGLPLGDSATQQTSMQTTSPSPLVPNRQATPRHTFTELVTMPRLSLRMVCLAVVLAVALGALHALEPGHGKTVVAAYLVGARGTAWHAVYLGLIVTATHTVGVYLLGVVTLSASHYIVPERLYPWLAGLSGLLIAGVGCGLLRQRYAERKTGHSHGHAHRHAHASSPTLFHVHQYGPAHAHSHAPHHAHVSTQAHAHTHAAHHDDHHHDMHETISPRTLLTLGVTGGLVPCPAALVVLLSAMALQRVGFGLLLIVAFSVGLATVLIGIGLFMVYARRFMSRFHHEGALITRWLPLASAVTVTVLGIAMVVHTLMVTGVLPLRL